MKYYAIIVAGGLGNRMNNPVPKQFLKLNGRPVIMHTITRFHECELKPEIIVVLHKDHHVVWKQLCEEFHFEIPHRLTSGGDTRFLSVRSGLRQTEGEGIVAIHDAARPLVHSKTILHAYKAAEMYGNAVPAIPLSDSIRKVDPSASVAVDRTKYCVVQTPQVFHSELLRRAYAREFKITFTDDASVVESLGETIHLIDGTPDNIKITTPMDLAAAEALLAYQPFERGK
ncbi:MAG: 2-C-methyl-D-erythritol 4-phosphate cytidylyltransferase [Bacteroidia bacterium]|nr:2-C-methyl-D-erythritol 4-phosphate cytidylyltransferase [Bacteroidia bacterium]